MLRPYADWAISHASGGHVGHWSQVKDGTDLSRARFAGEMQAFNRHRRVVSDLLAHLSRARPCSSLATPHAHLSNCARISPLTSAQNPQLVTHDLCVRPRNGTARRVFGVGATHASPLRVMDVGLVPKGQSKTQKLCRGDRPVAPTPNAASTTASHSLHPTFVGAGFPGQPRSRAGTPAPTIRSPSRSPGTLKRAY